MDRRQSIAEQLAFYEHQARLVRLGLSTRRSAEFYDRQAQYFRGELR